MNFLHWNLIFIHFSVTNVFLLLTLHYVQLMPFTELANITGTNSDPEFESNSTMEYPFFTPDSVSTTENSSRASSSPVSVTPDVLKLNESIDDKNNPENQTTEIESFDNFTLINSDLNENIKTNKSESTTENSPNLLSTTTKNMGRSSERQMSLKYIAFTTQPLSSLQKVQNMNHMRNMKDAKNYDIMKNLEGRTKYSTNFKVVTVLPTESTLNLRNTKSKKENPKDPLKPVFFIKFELESEKPFLNNSIKGDKFNHSLKVNYDSNTNRNEYGKSQTNKRFSSYTKRTSLSPKSQMNIHEVKAKENLATFFNDNSKSQNNYVNKQTTIKQLTNSFLEEAASNDHLKMREINNQNEYKKENEFQYSSIYPSTSNMETRIPSPWKTRKVNSYQMSFESVCDLDKDEGYGSDSFSSWYFNYKNGKCEWFSYRGYGGNGNRFYYRANCEHSCIEKYENICERTDIVNCVETWLQCKTLFNIDCERRTKNSYDHRICQPSQPICVNTNRNIRKPPIYPTHRSLIPPDCRLEKNPGNCKMDSNSLLMYYYDYRLNDCLGFLYTSCGGNLNKFSSRKDCMDRCAF